MILGKFMFDVYDKNQNIKPVFSDNSTKLYFLQQGVYSTKKSMQENIMSFSQYIYTIENNQYYVFVGITNNSNNKDKLKGYFKNKGYSIYVKEITVDNQEFVNALLTYDSLLEKTNDEKAIGSINDQILKKYEELIKKSEH